MFERVPEPELMLDKEQCETYNQEFIDDQSIVEDFVNTYKQCIGLDQGSVVDLGSGSCNFIIALANAYPGLTFTCYEASYEMIKIAINNIRSAGLADRIQLVQQDFFNATGQFDVAIANRVLHHVNDTEGFWNLISKLGSKVLVCDLERPYTSEFLNYTLPADFINSLKSAYTVNEVSDQIVDYDYTIEKKSLQADLSRFTVFTKKDK